MNGLMLHCGADAISREQLAIIPTPEPMGPRHCPSPFIDTVDLVTNALHSLGLQITSEAYGALKDGSRFFGLMDIGAKHLDDWSTCIGLRGSHDQSLGRGIVVGSHVFVCDNLCFSGDINIQLKQTLNMGARLPGAVYQAVETLPGHFEVQEARYNAYKDTELKSRWGDAALIELVRRDVLPPSKLGKAIQEWDAPSHEEHLEHGRTVWTLMNAVTESLKPVIERDKETGEDKPTRAVAPNTMARTIRMTPFLDDICGFDLTAKAA